MTLPTNVTVHGLWEQNPNTESVSDCECDSVDIELNFEPCEQKFEEKLECSEGILFESNQFFDCLKEVESGMNTFYKTKKIHIDLPNKMTQLINCIENRQATNKEQLVNKETNNTNKKLEQRYYCFFVVEYVSI